MDYYIVVYWNGKKRILSVSMNLILFLQCVLPTANCWGKSSKRSIEKASHETGKGLFLIYSQCSDG